jgi:LysM repeat protein
VVVALLLFVFFAGVALLLAPASQASAPAGPIRSVVVEPGDTLWSISVAALPSEDPYQAVDQVRRLNHMDADTVFVGQQLTLPPAR